VKWWRFHGAGEGREEEIGRVLNREGAKDAKKSKDMVHLLPMVPAVKEPGSPFGACLFAKLESFCFFTSAKIAAGEKPKAFLGELGVLADQDRKNTNHHPQISQILLVFQI